MPSLSSVALFSASVVLGIGTLFAFNSFFASPSYLERYYQFAAVKDTDDVRRLPKARLSAWKSMTTWATVLQSVPMFLMQIAMLTPFMLKIDVKARMVVSAAFMIVAMLLPPAGSASGNLSEGGALAVLFVAYVLAGLSTCVLQSSLFAFFGTMPTLYVTGFVFGSGLSGPINSVLRIIIRVGLPSSFHGVKTGAAVFFSIGMGFMLLTIVLVVLLRYNAIVVQYSSAYRRSDTTGDNDSISGDGGVSGRKSSSSLAPSHSDGAAAKADGAAAAVLARSSQSPPGEQGREPACVRVNEGETAAQQHGDDAKADGRGDEDDVSTAARQQAARDQSNALLVIRKIWPMMLCLAVNMFTTLTLFPGIGLAAMHTDPAPSHTPASASGSGGGGGSGGAQWEAEAIMPMVVVLMYNVGDTIGRGLSNVRRLWMPKAWVAALTAFRIVACVIPLVLGVVSQKYINSNANPIVVFLFLGITGGYVTGTTMGYGNSDEKLESEAEHATAGTCMCFSLLFGITFGSIASLLIVNFAIN